MIYVEGIILAAGLSKRAQTYKMTLKVGEKTILGSCIEKMGSVCSRIIVVGGYKFEYILPIIKMYPKAELIFNNNYEHGMYSSIKKGLEHIKSDRFFLTPGDYPLISSDVYKIMLDTCGDIIIPTYKGQKGHPVLMKSYLIKEILQNTKCSNLREFINSKKPIKIEVPYKGILMDVDTMEDYIKVCKYYSLN